MAITDNSFTAQELGAAIQANPALAAELKTFGSSTGYVVRNKDEDSEFMTNYENQIISKKTSEIANGIERDVAEVFGEPKLENEKYHDYAKRAILSSKQKLTDLDKQLKEAKEAAGTNGSVTEKARIKQLEDAILAEQKTAGTKIEEKDKEIHKLKSSFAIERALAPLRTKYKPGLPESVISVFEANIIEKLTNSMKEVDGQIVILDEKGEPVLDKNTYKIKTIAQVLEENLSDILDNGKQQAGAGTTESGQNPLNSAGGAVKDAQGKITAVTSVPSDIKTKVQLTNYLLKLGLTIDSKEYSEAHAKFGENLPLR